ncbi:MAG: co-chaperone GroES [Oligoflexus sp.]
MKIRPLHDRVVIKREDLDEKSRGGIIIPDNAQEKPIKGRVVVVGNGRINDDGSVRPVDVKEGQIVIFNKYAGVEIELDGEQHLILKEDEILGIIE